MQFQHQIPRIYQKSLKNIFKICKFGIDLEGKLVTEMP